MNISLSAQDNFVFWRLPGKKELFLLVGSLHPYTEKLADANGFVFSDFQNRKFLIKSNKLSVLEVPELQKINFTGPIFSGEPPLNHQESSEQYQGKCARVIAGIKQGMAGKVVLSRSKIVPCNQNPEQLFRKLLGHYPNAFCYFLHTAEHGTWLGASPEKLLDISAGEAEIYSLAGTNPAGTGNWQDKEIQEQQMVTEFLLEKIRSLGVEKFSISSKETVEAGPVEHLRTSIRIEAEPTVLFSLLDLIHPTPAVAGLPRDEAINIINDTEQRPRELYSGFLGSIGSDLGTHLFVNLRCMKMHANSAELFVGGGLTQLSVPEKEWDETELKAQTLMKILEDNGSKY